MTRTKNHGPRTKPKQEITEAFLKQWADASLKAYQTVIQQSRAVEIPPTFLLHTANGVLALNPPAALMGSGDGKEMLFNFLRFAVKRKNADATLFITDAFMGVPTEKQKQTNSEEMHELLKTRGYYWLEENGYVTSRECLIAVAQSPLYSISVSVQYTREDGGGAIVAFGERTEIASPQSGFGGRQKMFGDLRRENIG